jgi:hypothetical protein
MQFCAQSNFPKIRLSFTILVTSSYKRLRTGEKRRHVLHFLAIHIANIAGINKSKKVSED